MSRPIVEFGQYEQAKLHIDVVSIETHDISQKFKSINFCNSSVEYNVISGLLVCIVGVRAFSPIIIGNVFILYV